MKPVFKEPGMLLGWIGDLARGEAGYTDDEPGKLRRALLSIADQCDRFGALKKEKSYKYPKLTDLLLYILEAENYRIKNPIYYKDLARWTGFKDSDVSAALTKLKAKDFVASDRKGSWWPTERGKSAAFDPWKQTQ